MAKFTQHIKTESYVDFVKEAQEILDSESAKQLKEVEDLLLKSGTLVQETVTRKHFQAVADTLKAIPDQKKRKELANHHAEIFSKANPRFKRSLFMKASGVEE